MENLNSKWFCDCRLFCSVSYTHSIHIIRRLQVLYGIKSHLHALKNALQQLFIVSERKKLKIDLKLSLCVTCIKCGDIQKPTQKIMLNEEYKMLITTEPAYQSQNQFLFLSFFLLSHSYFFFLFSPRAFQSTYF